MGSITGNTVQSLDFVLCNSVVICQPFAALCTFSYIAGVMVVFEENSRQRQTSK